jgi:glycerate kinase
MPQRFLIAPDKFKGSLTALQAAAAMAAGILRVLPDAEIDLCPIADGGEGFMETLAPTLMASWHECPTQDALGRPIQGRYLIAETPTGPTAILEMAETAGMWRINPNELSPIHASTFGVGQQLSHAIQNHRVNRIILGLGGSATNDGGCGMAAALGVDFLNSAGAKINPTPANLMDVRVVNFKERMILPKIIAACDVVNPLLGENGATAVFSAQKGASAADQTLLENALTHLVSISAGKTASITPGAGAAGGLGFGLLHFADAKLVSGFKLLANLLNLNHRIATADHIITGEGALDSQSFSGKAPVALAQLANALGKPTTCFCGQAESAARNGKIFRQIHALADNSQPIEDTIANAASLLTELVAKSDFS